MDKLDILKALIQGQTMYGNVRGFRYDLTYTQFTDRIIACEVEYGLCNYFQRSFPDHDISEIIEELRVDRSFIHLQGLYPYWYPTAENFMTISEIQDNVIWPRLENLNRTIARLQHELNNKIA